MKNRFNARFTSNKWVLWLFMLISLLSVVLVGSSVFKELKMGVKDQRVFFWSCVSVLIGIACGIASIKGLFLLSKKGKIKKNKHLMGKINAKVICFEKWGKNNDTYYFVAKSGETEYSSEDFTAEVVGYTGNMAAQLELMQIPYHPNNIEQTLDRIEERKNLINMTLEEENTNLINRKLLEAALIAIEQVKESLKNNEAPYMKFNDKILAVGDEVMVYFDQEDPKYYRIDTDFLYKK